LTYLVIIGNYTAAAAAIQQETAAAIQQETAATSHLLHPRAAT